MATATAIPTPEAHPANEISFLETTLTGLRLVDSALQAFAVRNCTLFDVHFKNCTFSNVIFEDCSLKDVSLCNLEWTNVRVTGLVLRDVGWENIGLRNVCITNDQRMRRSHGVITIPVRDRGTTSLSRSLITVVLQSDTAPTSTTTHAAAIAIISKRRANLLQMPKTVLRNIVTHVFPVQSIFVRDRDITSYPNTRQTQYSLIATRGETRFYTYHGIPPPSSASDVSAHLKLPLAFLRVHSKFYRLAVRQLYARACTFATLQGCLAFLHDHQKPEQAISSLGLRVGPGTSLGAWKDLFDVLVWERREIQELRLKVGEEFWSTAPWEQGVMSVFEWDLGRNGKVENGRRRSFLGEVSRIPGSRLLSKEGQVRFLLGIEGAEGIVKREEFVRELEAAVRKEMMEVCEISGEVRRNPCCAVRVLERCCYWPEE